MDCAIFLPCRAGSQRVKKKNVRSFAGIDGGLLQIKMEQILGISSARIIMISTNDPLVVEVVRQFDDPRIIIDDRPEELASSATSTDDLIRYVPSVLQAEHILWTHVTSPFVTADVYNDVLDVYQKSVEEGHDSLMSVTSLQKFIWNEQGPLYDVSKENWPRTQTIAPLYEVNSAVFLAPLSVYEQQGNRIGKNPFLYKMEDEVAFDIDWEHEFMLAEQIFLQQQDCGEAVIP